MGRAASLRSGAPAAPEDRATRLSLQAIQPATSFSNKMSPAHWYSKPEWLMPDIAGTINLPVTEHYNILK
ncbi:hypothetical protein EGT74_02950 [Chitinophaga lutea]|uniref:Uncharacterized protein n=1 Tax=Chitinophaga lutea TaxID=2488634 RepID=A0A3N4Q918_9BACT|nr:hypothetical protein [Chitinophaga lutea]RPE12527.1 hypothetical protein EGT74_02950 [Chitinophaga lutea]